MVNKTFFEAHKRASSFLKAHGKEEQALLFVLLQQLKWTKTQWLLNMNEEIPKEVEELMQQDVRLLIKDHPPQYIVGFAEFYGLMFHVTSDTLIPRPETEELVALILSKCGPEEKTVVDIGTGSGAIAISLRKQRENWRVFATDISSKALQVAKSNGVELGVDVEFIETDVLEDVSQTFDVIVSNPPYISEAEIEEMDPSVLKYEPKLALFAENNGLAIYEKIAKEAQKKLNPHGKIFLEIGFQQKEAVEGIFKQAFPKKQVHTYQDLNGLDRMVVVEDSIQQGS